MKKRQTSYASGLLRQHLVEYGQRPIFEHAVIAVGNQQISDSIDGPLSKFGTRVVEIAQIRRGEALDEVFFDTASTRDDTIDLKASAGVVISKR